MMTTTDADEIEDSSAPLIEHMAELRIRLINTGGTAVATVPVIDGQPRSPPSARAHSIIAAGSP